MKISRVGYARCPGCLCHVKVVGDSTECPFCGDELREMNTIGTGAMEKIRSSRTALIAMGLAGGVTFAVACGDPSPKPNPEPNNTTNIDPGNDYGGFDPENNRPTDPQEDMGVEPEPEPDPEPDPGNDYGGFDPDDG